MSDQWKKCLLGDLVELKRGYDLPTSSRTPGDYPIVSSSGVSGTHVEAKVKAPGVVTGRYGTLGQVFYLKEDFWPLNTSLYVRDFKGNHPRFIAYFLGSLGLASSNAAGAVPGLNRNHLHQLEVYAPDYEVQQRVASILSTYDDLIENNTRRIEILEEMARRLYEEWFVHFRFPGHEEAELESVAVGDIAEVIRGRSYRSKDLVAEGGYPFVNLKCVNRDGGFRRDGLKRYEGKFKPDQVVHHGDIVMAVTDMTQERRIVARAAMVPDLEESGGIISMDLVKVSPKADISKEFLYAALRWSDFSENVKNHANGANVLHLHPDHIRSHVMQVPPDESRSEFSKLVKPIFDLCETLEKKNTNLRAQRDLLLHKLVSGEIDVSDIPMPDDKEVEAA